MSAEGSLKRLATGVIKDAIDDIRDSDVRLLGLKPELQKKVLDLIESAQIKVMWS